MKIKIRTIIRILACTFILYSCSSLQIGKCPYLITEQYVTYDTETEYFNYAGAFFSVLNNSDKDIKKITLCFSLFDEEGNILGVGNGQYQTVYEGEITAGSKKEIVLSLDNILSNENESSCSLDFVYISSITYADGSVWRDYIGLYSL